MDEASSVDTDEEVESDNEFGKKSEKNIDSEAISACLKRRGRPRTRGAIKKLREQGLSSDEINKMFPGSQPRTHADIENSDIMCSWKNIHLTVGDYNRLEPNEYLNDNILDMARERLNVPSNIYVYNTFFYKFLDKFV